MAQDSSQFLGSNAPALGSIFSGAQGSTDSYATLKALIDLGFADLPLPGSGRTLDRWRALAAVGRFDLSTAKLFESHTDAIAILAELSPEYRPPTGSLLAVWCAEPPENRVTMTPSRDAAEAVEICGTKAWCSGAAHVGHALVSVWDDEGRSGLVIVDMHQPGVHVTNDGWFATGMSETKSVNVLFNHAKGLPIGGPGAYLDRVGFHHGAAGVAACWYGAANAIAENVRESLRHGLSDPHAQAHLGAIDIALTAAKRSLHAAAAEIDARPNDCCDLAVRRARLAVEAAAEVVLFRAPRAIGVSFMCKDRRSGRLMADLPVFIRQSHAERDLAALGGMVACSMEESPWTL